jgi:hypothetical protein
VGDGGVDTDEQVHFLEGGGGSGEIARIGENALEVEKTGVGAASLKGVKLYARDRGKRGESGDG